MPFHLQWSSHLLCPVNFQWAESCQQPWPWSRQGRHHMLLNKQRDGAVLVFIAMTYTWIPKKKHSVHFAVTRLIAILSFMASLKPINFLRKVFSWLMKNSHWSKTEINGSLKSVFMAAKIDQYIKVKRSWNVYH